MKFLTGGGEICLTVSIVSLRTNGEPNGGGWDMVAAEG